MTNRLFTSSTHLITQSNSKIVYVSLATQTAHFGDMFSEQRGQLIVAIQSIIWDILDVEVNCRF